MVKELIYDKKVPTTRSNYVGIEIEFLMFSRREEELVEAINKRNLQWNVTLGRDGSIKDLEFKPVYEYYTVPWDMNRRHRRILNMNESRTGFEIKLLATESEMSKLIDDVCGILESLEATVNRTCGLHVHIDMRNRDEATAYNNFFKMQDVLFKMQPKQRRRNTYCKQLKRPVSRPDNGNHYHAINRLAYSELGTIEVRMHEGTIDAAEIKLWTYLLIKIANMKNKLTDNVEDISMLKFPARLTDYVLQRMEYASGS